MIHEDLARTTGSPEGPPVVRVNGVRKNFGATQALADAQLEVAAGDVHALVGRNGAGKSTLVSILTGLAAPDAGTVEYYGSPAPRLGDRQAWRSLVACVYQKLSVIDELTVAENLMLNRQAEPRHRIRWREVIRRAHDLLDEWEIEVNPQTMAGDLGVESRQMLEIARALSFGARFVILDEPTARLDLGGVTRLFDKIRKLQQQGITFLFISHHLQEIFELCQRVTVFRDARHIVTADVSTMSREDLVEAMTGEAVLAQTDLRPQLPSASDVVLRVKELAGHGFDDISFQAHAHEIVGLAGSGGSRKYEIANAIVGLDRPASGSVTVGHTALGDGDVLGALRAGVGFTPQDRHESGFVPGLGIGENLTMTVPHRLGRRGVVRPGRREEFARSLITELDVVPAEPGYPVGQLSGGNQQKVVAGRAIADTPRLLVLMAPTAGVDVKSRTSLMDTAVRSAERGAAVLVVTDDLDDLRYCHRVLVLHRGRIVTELHDSWTDQQVVAAMEGMTASE